MDLSDAITIGPKTVEVYEDPKYKHQGLKPRIGEKLNKEAIITLYNIFPKKHQSAEEKEAYLQKKVED